MPRWRKASTDQDREKEAEAANYRRTGARVMKASLEPVLAQAEADAALVRDLASFDPVREYGVGSTHGPILACAICNAVTRAKTLDHDPNCLWTRARRATTQRVRVPTGLPETDLLKGPEE